ncbi:hypothetical protein PL373_18890 [Tenacibaculum maritimum]|nr:hypothetical protein [Tenacibaculum maritimum]MDB0603155.1 hypothetical protein [Tenacibaculum maritimum]MDB0610419.1 hypothetical protein [Tenacibaculum maritimum]
MYFTEQRVDITKRIEQGKTTLFFGLSRKTELEVEKLAEQKRSYVYDVFQNSEFDRLELVGYAVPN